MRRVATFYKYKMMKKIGSIFPSILVELDDVTKVFNEHTNHSSRLREIGKSQLVENYKKLAGYHLQNVNNKILQGHLIGLKNFMFILIHIANLFPNYVF
jgi:hypothetical protein